jgi:ribonuclease E
VEVSAKEAAPASAEITSDAAPQVTTTATDETEAPMPVVAGKPEAEEIAVEAAPMPVAVATETAAERAVAIEDEASPAAAVAEVAAEPVKPVESVQPEAERAQVLVQEVATPEAEVITAAPAAVAAEPAPVEHESPAASAPIDLGSVLAESGLVMIETQSEKVSEEAGRIAPAPIEKLGRRPRPAPVIVEEPLQQVETHK